MTKEGTLFFDKSSGRYDVVFHDGTYYGGLHCGNCFEILANNTWTPTSIEHGRGWYLVGFNGIELDGLKVRM